MYIYTWCVFVTDIGGLQIAGLRDIPAHVLQQLTPEQQQILITEATKAMMSAGGDGLKGENILI